MALVRDKVRLLDYSVTYISWDAAIQQLTFCCERRNADRVSRRTFRADEVSFNHPWCPATFRDFGNNIEITALNPHILVSSETKHPSATLPVVLSAERIVEITPH